MTVERRTYVFYIKYFTNHTTPSSEALQLHLEKKIVICRTSYESHTFFHEFVD
jgi:hypothetical protein